MNESAEHDPDHDPQMQALAVLITSEIKHYFAERRVVGGGLEFGSPDGDLTLKYFGYTDEDHPESVSVYLRKPREDNSIMGEVTDELSLTKSPLRHSWHITHHKNHRINATEAGSAPLALDANVLQKYFDMVVRATHTPARFN